MATTVGKHIGEGFGKGELYAALNYDESDAFGGMKLGNIRIQGQLKVHNRPLTTNVFALEVKSDVKNAIGTYTGALQVTVREYPTDDTSAVTVNGSDFTTYLHSGDTKTDGYLTSIKAKAENQGTFNGAGIIMSPIYSLIGASGTFTKVSVVTALWLDTHMASTISDGNYYMAYLSNNGTTTMNAMIRFTAGSSGNTTALFSISGADVVSDATTADYTFTTYKKIKIELGGVAYYLIADTS